MVKRLKKMSKKVLEEDLLESEREENGWLRLYG